jgi:hypothetical protein
MTTAPASECQKDVVLHSSLLAFTPLSETSVEAGNRSSNPAVQVSHAASLPPQPLRRDLSSVPLNIHMVYESTKRFAQKKPQPRLNTSKASQEAPRKRGRPRQYANNKERSRVEVIRKRMRREQIAPERRDCRFKSITATSQS